MKKKELNELKKLEKLIATVSERLPGFYGNWYLTDDGILDDQLKCSLNDPESIVSDMVTIKDYTSTKDNTVQNYQKYIYEVYHEPVRKNFIIISYPIDDCTENFVYGTNFYNNYKFGHTMESLGAEVYNYLANELNRSHSTILYCHDHNEDDEYSYDIYYDVWDIGEVQYDKEKASYKYGGNFTTYDYLKSLMVAEGLDDCEYMYRDIRKGKVYPSKFFWMDMDIENMSFEEYQAQMEIEKFVRLCEKL